LVHIEKLTSVNHISNQQFWRQHCRIRKQGYSGDLDFIILFVPILSLYAINLNDVSLLVNLSFTFLTMLIILLYLISDILYQFE